MTKQISPQQEARLGELARDFEIALAIPVAKFGGGKGRKTQLDRIATDIIAVFSGSQATFAGDASQAREAVMNRYLSATAAGREVLKRKNISSNTGTVRTIDVLRARGDAEPRSGMIDRMLSATDIGRKILADRKKAG
jgi:ribosomal protein L34